MARNRYEEEKGVIALLGSWTGEMMNWARIQMKTWIMVKNDHKANVQHQRRWDNRGIMTKVFQRWRKSVWHEYGAQEMGKEEGKRVREKERTYGIKHWGRVRTIPRTHKQVKHFLQMGIG
eukprot:6177382-Pleurochrysis_carterae.AAC.1